MRYDYECRKCEIVFEIEKRMSDPAPSCPKCGGETERHFGPEDSPPLIYAGRPVWTYNDAKKYKQCSMDGGPVTKIDPGKHGDLGSWHSPGPIVKKGKK